MKHAQEVLLVIRTEIYLSSLTRRVSRWKLFGELGFEGNSRI